MPIQKAAGEELNHSKKKKFPAAGAAGFPKYRAFQLRFNKMGSFPLFSFSSLIEDQLAWSQKGNNLPFWVDPWARLDSDFSLLCFIRMAAGRTECLA